MTGGLGRRYDSKVPNTVNRAVAARPSGPPPRTWFFRLLTWLGLFGLGAGFGLLGTIAHQAPLSIWPVVPLGLVVALAAIACLMIGLRHLVARSLVLASALGVIGAVLLLSGRGPGGSVLVPDNALGVVWSIAPGLIALGVVIWPRLPANMSA